MTWLLRLWCRLAGHRWERVDTTTKYGPTVYAGPFVVITSRTACSRCGAGDGGPEAG